MPHRCATSRLCCKHVLAIAGAELQAAEQVHDLFVNRRADVGFVHGRPADFQDVLFHLFLSLDDDFLDARRVDAAVLDQLLQSKAGGFAAHVVEGADDDDAWRVVDDHVDAGRLLERADIAAFAADDAPFHVVAGNVDGADGRVGGVLRGVALDRGRQDFAGLLFALRPESLVVLLQARRDLAGHFAFEPFEQHFLRLFAAHARQFVQAIGVLLGHDFEFFAALFDVFALLGEFLLIVFEQAFFLLLFAMLHFDRVFAFFHPAFVFAQFARGRFPFRG